jgi:hypothetical protein
MAAHVLAEDQRTTVELGKQERAVQGLKYEPLRAARWTSALLMNVLLALLVRDKSLITKTASVKPDKIQERGTYHASPQFPLHITGLYRKKRRMVPSALSWRPFP